MARLSFTYTFGMTDVEAWRHFRVWGGKGWFRFASYSDVRRKARLIFIIVVWHRRHVAASEGTDVEVDYVSSGCSFEARRTDIKLIGVISGYGVDRDTFRFASYSDTLKLTMSAQARLILFILGVAKGDINPDAEVQVKCQNLVPGLGLALVGECAIQFQDYSEARVISMMTVEFQATVLR
ncbi:Immunoglobulin Heavy Variable 1-69-2 [Manis pentadactyla]|nr:Immunoglobulin Heavy Variable 1-69-2 [Manis pentadactyla]